MSEGHAAKAVDLYLLNDGAPELVHSADSLEEATAIVDAFNKEELRDPTGGKLLIHVH